MIAVTSSKKMATHVHLRVPLCKVFAFWSADVPAATCSTALLTCKSGSHEKITLALIKVKKQNPVLNSKQKLHEKLGRPQRLQNTQKST